MIAQHSYLMDGPLMELYGSRERLIGQMATDLLAQRAYTERGDAIMVLLAAGYRFVDVFCLVDDAIYLAKQEVVGEAMGDR